MTVMKHIACVIAVVVTKADYPVGLAPGEHFMGIRKLCIKGSRARAKFGPGAGGLRDGGQQAAAEGDDNTGQQATINHFVFHIFTRSAQEGV